MFVIFVTAIQKSNKMNTCRPEHPLNIHLFQVKSYQPQIDRYMRARL